MTDVLIGSGFAFAVQQHSQLIVCIAQKFSWFLLLLLLVVVVMFTCLHCEIETLPTSLKDDSPEDQQNCSMLLSAQRQFHFIGEHCAPTIRSIEKTLFTQAFS